MAYSNGYPIQASVLAVVFDKDPDPAKACMFLYGNGTPCTVAKFFGIPAVNLRSQLLSTTGAISFAPGSLVAVIECYQAPKYSPKNDQYRHTDKDLREIFVNGNILLTKAPGAPVSPVHAFYAALDFRALQNPPLPEGLTDVVGLVESCERDPNGRTYLHVVDETGFSLKVTFWPEHARHLPALQERTSVVYLKDVRFTAQHQFGSNWSTCVLKDLDPERSWRVYDMRRSCTSASSSATSSPNKSVTSSPGKPGGRRSFTLKEIKDRENTGCRGLTTVCSIKDFVRRQSAEYARVACPKCYNNTAFEADGATFCPKCKTLVEAIVIYSIQAILTDVAGTELCAFLDNNVAVQLLGMDADTLDVLSRDDREQVLDEVRLGKPYRMLLKSTRGKHQDTVYNVKAVADVEEQMLDISMSDLAEKGHDEDLEELKSSSRKRKNGTREYGSHDEEEGRAGTPVVQARRNFHALSRLARRAIRFHEGNLNSVSGSLRRIQAWSDTDFWTRAERETAEPPVHNST